MKTYPKDVIADLIAGTLPWAQTKDIMSSYKDEDRFFKAVEVLQERVPWDDPIVLPIGEHLFIASTAAGMKTKCECGLVFGPHDRNWKLEALINVRRDPQSLAQIYPHSDCCDGDWMELREFICPGCATLLEVEACAPGFPIVHDFEPDLEAFYNDWLGRPVPKPASRTPAGRK